MDYLFLDFTTDDAWVLGAFSWIILQALGYSWWNDMRDNVLTYHMVLHITVDELQPAA